jgi:hypothetical protein
MAGVFSMELTEPTLTIYDSAPSESVRKAMHATISKWWEDLAVLWGYCPRQNRYSEDCGVFTVVTLIAVAHNIRINFHRALPDNLRRILFEERVTINKLKEVTNLLTAVQGAGEDTGTSVSSFNATEDRQRRAAQIARAVHEAQRDTERETPVQKSTRAPAHRTPPEQPGREAAQRAVTTTHTQDQTDPQHPFARGHQSHPAVPLVTQITTDDLARFLEHTQEPHQPLVAVTALARTTRDEHRRFFREIIAMPHPLRTMTVDMAILTMYLQRHKERTWTWATLHKKLANAQHAMAILPFYRQKCSHGVNMMHSVIFQQVMKAVTREKQMEKSRIPEPMTPTIFVRTMALRSVSPSGD